MLYPRGAWDVRKRLPFPTLIEWVSKPQQFPAFPDDLSSDVPDGLRRTIDIPLSYITHGNMSEVLLIQNRNAQEQDC